MKFREIVDSPCGLRYIFEKMELQSGYARKTLLDADFMTDAGEIESAHVSLRKHLDLVMSDPHGVENTQMRLQSLRDISGTLSSLEDGAVLDDIELFEIKHLALLDESVNGASDSMERVVDILDPDGLRISTFYIYDSYSVELREARAALENDPDNEELKDEVLSIEDEIKQELSRLLRPFTGDLRSRMKALALLDIGLAKALLMKEEGMVIPSVSDHTSFKGMFNPEVRAILEKKGKKFQSVDFDFNVGATSTVIGANMGGKTVALKTLCLSQYLFQFGFAVPAVEAGMAIFDQVQFCIGDMQSEQKGLSSFAAEMLRINNVIMTAGRGVKLLALIDEPARTTNPVEGSALVSALLKILSDKPNLSLVLTTHYKVENAGQCWRVKGLQGGSAGLKMDYSLIRSESNEVPHEALNIARELNINDEWINTAAQILNIQTNTL